MDYMQILYVFFPALLSGLVQSTTGFGAGIVMMLFFPLFLAVTSASALSQMVSILSVFGLFWHYRKKADFKKMLAPLPFYIGCSTLAIWSSTIIDVSSLKAWFGLFMTVLAIYFLFFSNKVKIKGNLLTAAVCGGLSGFLSGFFGIGGPPMVLYFLAVTEDDKETYMGTLEAFFFVTMAYTLCIRIANGIITLDLLKLVPFGIVGSFLGNHFGTKIVDRVNVKTLKLIIYSFLAVSGLLTFFTSI